MYTVVKRNPNKTKGVILYKTPNKESILNFLDKYQLKLKDSVRFPQDVINIERNGKLVVTIPVVIENGNKVTLAVQDINNAIEEVRNLKVRGE